MRDSAGIVRHTLRTSLRADKWTTIGVATLVVFQSGFAAAIALAQRMVVDSQSSGILVGLLIAVAIGAAAYTLQLVGQRVAHNYRNDLCNRIQMSLEQEITEAAARIPTVTHLERADFLNRVSMLRRGALALTNTGWAAAYALSAVASILLSFWLLAAIHPLLVLLALCAIPILPLTNRAVRLQRAAIDATSESLRREEALHHMCLDPEHAKEVWISGNGADLDRRANRLWDTAVRREVRARLWGMVGEIGGWAVFFAALAGTLYLVGSLVNAGQASAGDVVLIISLAGQLRLQQFTAVQAISQVADGGRVAEHYNWLLRRQGESATEGLPAPYRLERGIELREVSFTYPGTSEPVLKDVNLTVRPGGSLGIVGINGAGKSTLVKLLTGVYQPTSGRILVDGVDLREMDPAAWLLRCSGVLQDFTRFQVPVREAVGAGDLPRMDEPGAVRQALSRAGADQLVADLPAGVSTQLGRTFGGSELSQGQWQRLALARGLMREDSLLLLLDEPTAALDPQAEHELFALFAEQTKESSGRGAVTLLVSHRFSTMHLADRIVVIADGCVSEQGTHAELMAANGEYADLYRTQALAYR